MRINAIYLPMHTIIPIMADSIWSVLDAKEKDEKEDTQQDISYISVYRDAYESYRPKYTQAEIETSFPRLNCPDIIYRNLVLNLKKPTLWYILSWEQMWENTLWQVTQEEPDINRWKKMQRAAEKEDNRRKRRWNQKMGEEIYEDVEDSSEEE